MILYMDMETSRPRGRPINRWLDEVREIEKIVVGGEWQEWKKLLRMAGIIVSCTSQWN
jgi:hypothetical protein